MTTNTPAALALLDSLLREGVWAVEATTYRDGGPTRGPVAIRCRRLRKDEQPGAPPASRVNERGMIETTYFPAAD